MRTIIVIFFSSILIMSLTVVSFGIDEYKAFAHKDGCHRWHSCPSDTGSYVCGDLGISTYCPTKYTDNGPLQVI